MITESLRTQKEVSALIDKCSKEPNKYPGQTYAEGVRDALDWITGESDDNPMED